MIEISGNITLIKIIPITMAKLATNAGSIIFKNLFYVKFKKEKR